MAHEIKSGPSQRRYVRVRGPFDADYLDHDTRPALIYDLNLGGGFVNFSDPQPVTATLKLRIDLPREGPVTVNAEAVYCAPTGIAVRFVEMDLDTAARLARTIDAFTPRPL